MTDFCSKERQQSSAQFPVRNSPQIVEHCRKKKLLFLQTYFRTPRLHRILGINRKRYYALWPRIDNKKKFQRDFIALLLKNKMCFNPDAMRHQLHLTIFAKPPKVPDYNLIHQTSKLTR
jgi:hypothetical protein